MKERIGKIYRRWFVLIVLLWILFVMYPNPANLAISIKRVFDPEIDTEAVAQIAAQLPDDPTEIEIQIKELIPYSYDWEVYGMPWYFPSADQILESGKGDCKARTLVLASVLEAKGIPYSINASITHMWVGYESKTDTVSENSSVSYYQQDLETGERSFSLPSVSVAKVADVWSDGFWSPMPISRKVLLAGGVPALFVLRFTWLRKRLIVQQEEVEIHTV